MDDPAIYMLRNGGRDGLSDKPDEICTGSNGGYQALNLAILSGAQCIVLLGYDAKPGAQGKKHWFGDHPDKTSAPYDDMARAFKAVAKQLAAAGVEVLNASPDSAIDCFERVTIESLLPDPPAAVVPA